MLVIDIFCATEALVPKMFCEKLFEKTEKNHNYFL